NPLGHTKLKQKCPFPTEIPREIQWTGQISLMTSNLGPTVNAKQSFLMYYADVREEKPGQSGLFYIHRQDRTNDPGRSKLP
ncbi:hypothetical protein PJP10_32600, partial [Mycobacterium kansasii]